MLFGRGSCCTLTSFLLSRPSPLNGDIHRLPNRGLVLLSSFSNGFASGNLDHHPHFDTFLTTAHHRRLFRAHLSHQSSILRSHDLILFHQSSDDLFHESIQLRAILHSGLSGELSGLSELSLFNVHYRL